jgi:hypothetical protein
VRTFFEKKSHCHKEGSRVLLEELVPSPFATLGAGIEAISLEDGFDRIPGDRADSQLFEFA